jgi:O-antigen ligase
MFPGAALCTGIFLIAVSPDNFLALKEFADDKFPSLGIASAQKIVVLVTMIPAFMRYGLRPNINWGIMAVLAIFLVTAVFSSRFPSLTPFQMVKTLIGLLMPLAYFSMPLPKRWIDPFLLLVSSIPLLSILFGLIAHLLELQDLIGRVWLIADEDVTGSWRLGGVNIPSALAFFCFIAIITSFYQGVINKKRGYLILLIAAVIELILTGTRTPLLCSILMLALAAVLASPSDVRGNSKFALILGGSVIVGIALALYWPNLVQRNSAAVYHESGGLNTSGRAEIWSIAWDAFIVNPAFGRGLGTGAIILLDDLKRVGGAMAVHNEFLHLLLDAGIFGLVTYLGGVWYMIAEACRHVSNTTVRYISIVFLAFAAYSATDNTISGAPTLVFFFGILLILRDAAARQGVRLTTSRWRTELVV